MPAEWQLEYRMKFNMSVPERKRMEEGPNGVFNAHQWGFYEDAEAVDGLISWLDPRGFNEVKLKKELTLYRDRIVRHMEKRKEYLNPTEEKSVDSGKRMSTRKQQQHHPDYTAHRCLAWHNNMALEDLGHLHSDQPRARRPAKKAAPPPPVIEEERVTRSDTKSKRESKGRQGTRYNF